MNPVEVLEQKIVENYTFNGERYFMEGNNKIRLHEILKMLYKNYKTIASRLGYNNISFSYTYNSESWKFTITQKTNDSQVIVPLQRTRKDIPRIDIIMEGHKTKVMALTKNGVEEIMNNELQIVVKRKLCNFNF